MPFKTFKIDISTITPNQLQYILQKELGKQFILDNLNEIFKTDGLIKMCSIVETILNNKDKYKYFINELLNHKSSTIRMLFINAILSSREIDKMDFKHLQSIRTMIEYNCVPYIQQLIEKYISKSKKQTFEYLGHGTTADVFRIGDYTIKLPIFRYCKTWERHFRINKVFSNRPILNSKNFPIFHPEVSQFIIRDENAITEKMIYELFLDLKAAGLEVLDCHCLNYKPDNFALLQNYRDADIIGFSSPEELPHHFKETPLILIDTDLIYKLDDPAKDELDSVDILILDTMEDAIKKYEKKKQFN